jgi:signal transduction histidine kinase
VHQPPSIDELRSGPAGPATPAIEGDDDADGERRLVRPRRAIDLACRAAAEVLERVSDAFLAFDGSDRVVYVNRRATALMGTPTGALVGRPLDEALPAPVVRALTAMGSRGRARGDGPTTDAAAHPADDSAGVAAPEDAAPLEVDVSLESPARWVALRAFPFDDGWAVYLRDVTPRKRAEAEREALLEREQGARQEAEAAGRAQSEFLAMMSHELRTPINAFKGYVQLLELEVAGPVTAQQRDYLGRLGASSDHLLTLINDVLDVAKVDAGRLAVAREVGSAAGAVDAALALTLPLLDEKSLHLHQRCAPREPAVSPGPASDVAPGATAGVAYLGDADRVRQILVNLLSNAVKFTPAGGAITVACATVAEAPPEARVRGAGPWTLLTVQDTGVGIPPEEQAAVFEPFHQVDSGHTRRAGGTGLGLAISRRLARLMHGDLTLRSAVGQGSCFTLWLPGAGADGAEPPSALAVPPGLAELGLALRAEIDAVLATLTERLRADPETPVARGMRQPALEDHAITLLGDMAQSLVIIADAGAQAAELLRDGSEIERIVADRHGLRRHAQGWTVAALRREYAILSEVVERAVRARVAGAGEAGARRAEEALGVLAGLLRHAMAISVRAWERAERARAEA